MRILKVSTVAEYIKRFEAYPSYSRYWFRGVAKSSYTPVPKLLWKKATEYEGSLEHEFLISYKSYLDSSNLNSWEVFALMQHHGLPTRLLDWSESPLIALFFALTSEPSSNSYRVVWVMDPFSLNNAVIGERVVFCPAVIEDTTVSTKSTPSGAGIDLNSYLPPNLSPDTLEMPDHPLAISSTQHMRRISSQRGCFTVHGHSPDPIDSYLEKDVDFHMIKIDARTKKARKSMLKTLSNIGIDEEHIYKDLDSLCARINREFGY